MNNDPGMPSKCILLVEDEALVALDAEDALLEAGYDVVGPAYRLDEALDFVRGGAQFHAAVLDVNLAGSRVWPVADILFERKIPFVLLSGFGKDIGCPPSCDQAPRLSKPLCREELIEALAALFAPVRSTSRKVCLPSP